MSEIPVIDLKRTGDRIKDIRKSKGITVRQLQDVFGFSSPQAIYKWQSGESLPTLDNIVILARIFEVSIEDIVITE